MRVIVRGDLDGIICAALLKETALADTVLMTGFKAFLDNEVLVTDEDIICNLPYHPTGHMWFRHYTGEQPGELPLDSEFSGAFVQAPSTARVVYDYLLTDHPGIARFRDLVADNDRLVSADLSVADVRQPQLNLLLGFLLDRRSGVLHGSPGGKTIAELEQYATWKARMPDLLRSKSAEAILELPETREWYRYYRDNQEEGIRQVKACSHLDGNVIVSDFRGRLRAPLNRFVIYTLPEFSAGNISIQITNGKPEVDDEISVAYSIFNRTATVDVGNLCAWYGGGGHRSVGVCRPAVDEAEQVFQEILAACKETVPAA